MAEISYYITHYVALFLQDRWLAEVVLAKRTEATLQQINRHHMVTS
jgi:hypothetical protein